MDRERRKRYWDDSYVAYWKARVAESGSGRSRIIQGDVKTEDDEVYERVFADHPFRPGKLLDVGCAWGRMFPIYRRFGLNIHGVDISRAMISEAEKAWSGDAAVASLLESEAESLPFPDSHFENVACLATFDCTFQDEALSEFIRVLREGGLLYLTGKNADYHDSDEMALAAEAGARSKGEPNYFTDVPSMLGQLAGNGHVAVGSYYFPRRGDFGSFRFSKALPARFYEWMLIIQKGSGGRVFGHFSSDYSRTFERTRGKHGT